MTISRFRRNHPRKWLAYRDERVRRTAVPFNISFKKRPPTIAENADVSDNESMDDQNIHDNSENEGEHVSIETEDNAGVTQTQNVVDQGLHDNPENENDSVSIEENDDTTHNESVNDQDLPDNPENENDSVSVEVSDDTTHNESVDEHEMESAQIPSSHNRAIEEEAKPSILIIVSRTLQRICLCKKTTN
ncbi:unnamed protein product [Adineta steineri]|uniref:Uncharacterized protein n=3 Tax=Adineta steineri TaxID=433720 RepID=A0A815CGS5_9BILA|nr:unnamed protein product [Adineta steineri]CAF1283822.1 unnamed protein product [Adineta steineri]CAF3949762.1 unnamed protein product [Adineta steineri]CAF4072022.1 unnamed protein product [Adineta steineri]